MTIKYLPVIPPNLRPIIKLQDKTIIITDLNILYNKIINTNNKLKKIKRMLVPENFLHNELNSLQENVNLLIDNKKNQKLKSITNRLEGKKGRFRENLLGKTVDYSGRSVITVEPKLNLHQCEIPIEIAIELFQPHILKKLLQLKIVNNIRQGKKKIKSKQNIILIVLKKITKNYPILLNRAPTLHRISIQSFQPILTEDFSIKLHPLVCSAFNADFDGDQMGIHIPLSLKAKAEAQILMISKNNCNSPATGNSNLLLSQDMVLGCYFLTTESNSLNQILKHIKIYNTLKKPLNDYYKNKVKIHDYIWIREGKKQKNNDYIKIKKRIKNFNLIKFIVRFKIT
jgi:DNA-directed RNA polymerase subunit beta'